jgi:arabinofuranosyltransferase
VGLLLGVWGAWKLAYYGSLLPNTYHAKVAHELNANGIRYVWRFLHWYLIWPVLMLGALARLLFPSAPRFRLWPLWVVTCGWILYVVSIGGDFMEFRLFVPIAPFVFIGLAHLVHHPAKLLGHRLGTAATAAAVLLLVAASTHHARTFKGTTADDALDSIHLLSTFYGLYPDGRWDTLTNALQPLQQTDVVIGLFAVGAVPYYSRLATVDMYGLNSRDVATAGDALDRSAWRPGHRVQASLQQLHDHGVNLVIGHPRLVPLGVLNQGSAEPMCRSFIRAMMSSRTETVHDTAVVQMPVSPRVGLLMWYLTPHPRVDELVASGQWSIHRVRQVRFSTPP